MNILQLNVAVISNSIRVQRWQNCQWFLAEMNGLLDIFVLQILHETRAECQAQIVKICVAFSLYSHSTLFNRPRSIKQSVRMFVSYEVERFDIVSENAQLVGGLAELAHVVRAGDFEEKHVIVLKFGNNSRSELEGYSVGIRRIRRREDRRRKSREGDRPTGQRIEPEERTPSASVSKRRTRTTCHGRIVRLKARVPASMHLSFNEHFVSLCLASRDRLANTHNI